MRTYFRQFPTADQSFTTYWVEISTTDGYDDFVWFCTLIQVLLLNLGESPFYANYGIPAQQTVITQIFPDYYVNITQQQFAQYFSSLIITKIASTTPTYLINATTTQGFPISAEIALQPQYG